MTFISMILAFVRQCKVLTQLDSIRGTECGLYTTIVLSQPLSVETQVGELVAAKCNLVLQLEDLDNQAVPHSYS